MSPSTFAIIVAWNDREFLPELLASLAPAPAEDLQVLVVDNGSDDASSAVVRERFPHVAWLRNARNLGYAHAVNQGWRYARGAWGGEAPADRFVLLLSPDMVLTPDAVPRLRAALDAQPEAGSSGGVVRRAFRDPSSERPFAEAVRSDVIDHAGWAVRRDRRFIARGAGSLDRGQYADVGAPFGVSASFGLFRSSALEAAQLPGGGPGAGGLLDPALSPAAAGADLAWRLQLAGWPAAFAPAARAWRFCGAQAASDSAASSASSVIPPSDRWLLAAKNETLPSLLLALPWLFASWLGRAWKPSEAFAPFFVLAGLPSWRPKRRAVRALRRAAGTNLRSWFR